MLLVHTIAHNEVPKSHYPVCTLRIKIHTHTDPYTLTHTHTHTHTHTLTYTHTDTHAHTKSRQIGRTKMHCGTTRPISPSFVIRMQVGGKFMRLYESL